MKDKAVRRTARYVAGVYRIHHVSWWGRWRIVPPDDGPHVTVELGTRGRRVRRWGYLFSSLSKDVKSKLAFEREWYPKGVYRAR